MHDSLTPIGGLVPIAEMMLNNVFGGDGVGLINLITFAILTVFIIRMMIGRTPEFLGKKIESREMKLVMIAVLAHPFSILGFTALAAIFPDSFGNKGRRRKSGDRGASLGCSRVIPSPRPTSGATFRALLLTTKPRVKTLGCSV